VAARIPPRRHVSCIIDEGNFWTWLLERINDNCYYNLYLIRRALIAERHECPANKVLVIFAFGPRVVREEMRRAK
jgi:hypothetical protein